MHTTIAIIIIAAVASYAVTVTGGAAHLADRVHAMTLPACSATLLMRTECDAQR